MGTLFPRSATATLPLRPSLWSGLPETLGDIRGGEFDGFIAPRRVPQLRCDEVDRRDKLGRYNGLGHSRDDTVLAWRTIVARRPRRARLARLTGFPRLASGSLDWRRELLATQCALLAGIPTLALARNALFTNLGTFVAARAFVDVAFLGGTFPGGAFPLCGVHVARGSRALAAASALRTICPLRWRGPQPFGRDRHNGGLLSPH